MNKSTEQNKRRGFLSKMMVMGASGVALFSSSAYAKKSGTTRLTKKQKDRLYFIYQEEKVARDVYIYANGVHPDENTFASIKNSEQRHIDSAEELCIKYDIDLSNIDENDYGTFDDDYLQGLYDECIDAIDLDDTDLLAALKIGEHIEITDIGTLTDTIEEMDMPDDVIKTYEILREGSYNHLESFEAAIARESR